MTTNKLWEPIIFSGLESKNRLVMAPMTRSRANENGTVDKDSALYYSQRASMGLIISEGTQPSLEGQGYMASPGIYTQEQIAAWKEVTEAVHKKGGTFFIQLMHAGRMNHPDNTPDHHQGVAPSAVAPNSQIFTPSGRQEIPVPKEMTKEDIQRTIQDFRVAARSAIEAGADGVEIHGANGYLIHEFFGVNSNVRTDEYGGSIENRIRFALEVTEAIVDEIGADRVGFRISPFASFSTIDDGEDGEALYQTLVKKLNTYGLAYLHILFVENEPLLESIRQSWDQIFIVNRSGREREELTKDLDKGIADMVSVATWALANPDLVDRLKEEAPFNQPDPTTFFGGGSKGYIDYPVLNEVK